MSRKNRDWNECNYNHYDYRTNKPQKHYGLGNFILDLFLFSITGGLWGIYLIFKFLKK